MNKKIERVLERQEVRRTISTEERVYTSASSQDADAAIRSSAQADAGPGSRLRSALRAARMAPGLVDSDKHPTMTHAVIVETADGREPPTPTPERAPAPRSPRVAAAPKMVAGEHAELLSIVGNHLRVVASRLRPTDGREPGVLLRTITAGLKDAALLVESQAAHRLSALVSRVLDLEKGLAERLYSGARTMAYAQPPRKVGGGRSRR